jgi:hypothetical protein
MGNGQSTRVQRRMWSRTPFRYHRISPSNSLNQPLLDDDSQVYMRARRFIIFVMFEYSVIATTQLVLLIGS